MNIIQPEDIDVNEWHWGYAICRADGTLDNKSKLGPLTDSEIEAILGAPFELLELHDHHNSVIAVRRDRDEKELPWNQHYQSGIRGDVLTGKFVRGTKTFVGLIGFSVRGKK